MNILIVEDDHINQIVLKRLLEHFGEVECANHGEEGLQMFIDSCENNKPFSVIFMDIRMPIMDGYQATREIRMWEQEHCESQKTSIVINTGEQFDEENFVGLGYDAFLQKPITFEQIESFMGEVQ